MADTYDILNVTERTRLMQGQGFVDVEDVTYKTKPGGIIGTITVAKSDADPEHVAQLVAEDAARKHAIKNL